jgi:hypothetical protein
LHFLAKEICPENRLGWQNSRAGVQVVSKFVVSEPMPPSDSDNVLFPDPSEIVQHAIEFARMMFVFTSFEREVSALQDAITRKDGFGEQRGNQWRTRERPGRMVKLIEKYRGNALAETAQIEKLLTDAIDPCEQRNLAHGNWWCFNRRTSTIVVRGAMRWEHPEVPPEHREYTAPDIHEVAEKLAAIEVELYKLRCLIEPPPHRPTNSAGD